MLHAYSIVDKPAESWLTLSLFSNDSVAIRAFKDLLSSSSFSPHKADYALYDLGEFDTSCTDFSSVLEVNPLTLCKPVLVFDGSDLKEANNE